MKTPDPQTAATVGDRSGWSGRLFLWPGRAFYLGPTADTAVHAHHAIQLCIAIEESFALRAGPDEPWQTRALALIPPDSPHQLDGRGASLAMLYADPEDDFGRELLRKRIDQRFEPAHSNVPPAIRERLQSLAELPRSFSDVKVAIDALVGELAPTDLPPRQLDSRVAGLLRRISAAPSAQLRAAEAASSIGLSVYRFQHVFRASTGTTFRRYLLWSRLVAAMQVAARGSSLTEAAHAAGFSDSAHLSRTFRSMFGLSPSEIVRASTFVQVSTRIPS